MVAMTTTVDGNEDHYRPRSDENGDIETTARLLALLALLQSRSAWNGPELADRLEVTVRTVRRDVDRLRQLGYPVESTAGTPGGYHLGAGGSAMPPLMLDRDEAVAVAVSLRSTVAGTIEGGDVAADRALGKLEPLLPPALRRQFGAIVETTEQLGASGEAVSPDVLVVVTRACRDSEWLRVCYRNAGGRASDLTLEPHRVVATGRRWYLVARDRDRGEWRTYRIDRFVDVRASGHRVTIVDPPDAVAFVQDAITTAPYRYRVRALVEAPIDELAPRVPASTAVLSAHDDGRTLVTTGGDHLGLLAFHLLDLDRPFVVLDPAELRAELTRVAGLAGRAAAPAHAAGDEG